MYLLVCVLTSTEMFTVIISGKFIKHVFLFKILDLKYFIVQKKSYLFTPYYPPTRGPDKSGGSSFRQEAKHFIYYFKENVLP